jgi:hypothetical protein
MVRLEELGQLKTPMISSGIEPTTVRLVAKCLKKLLIARNFTLNVQQEIVIHCACILQQRHVMIGCTQESKFELFGTPLRSVLVRALSTTAESSAMY